MEAKRTRETTGANMDAVKAMQNKSLKMLVLTSCQTCNKAMMHDRQLNNLLYLVDHKMEDLHQRLFPSQRLHLLHHHQGSRLHQTMLHPSLPQHLET